MHYLHKLQVKKLKETLVTMQQLDKNMSNIRSWLSRIESELSRPITYSVCHHQEIQKRLAEQQVHKTHTPKHRNTQEFNMTPFILMRFLLSSHVGPLVQIPR
uniref:Uncharacterized protein n=1 Tax=Labrus bergylta TaxID=56723 RepID=A0A3Q3MMD2_9LABR